MLLLPRYLLWDWELRDSVILPVYSYGCKSLAGESKQKIKQFNRTHFLYNSIKLFPEIFYDWSIIKQHLWKIVQDWEITNHYLSPYHVLVSYLVMFWRISSHLHLEIEMLPAKLVSQATCYVHSKKHNCYSTSQNHILQSSVQSGVSEDCNQNVYNLKKLE